MEVKKIKIKHKFLMWCMEDYTSLFSLLSFVKEFYGYEDLDLLKKTTLDIAEDLAKRGFVNIGFLTNENTFKTWEDDIDHIIKKIKFQWDYLNRDLSPHEIVWFNATVKGVIEFECLDHTPEIRNVDSFYLDENTELYIKL